MKLDFELDIAENTKGPQKDEFTLWIETTLQTAGYQRDEAEISIMVVSPTVSQTLNSQYRDKDKPTNVLSFPADVPDYVETELLGDLVICAQVVEQEAEEQGKALLHHWAHMTVHGCLHLLGFDHLKDSEAEEMEALEIKVLAELDIPNPYIVD